MSTNRSGQRAPAIPRPAAVTSEPPPVLARSIEESIAALGSGETLASASPDTLLAAAERIFRDTLRAGCTGRQSAVALLVVDALVTYAFERASDDPARIEERAAQAMASLAALTDQASSA